MYHFFVSYSRTDGAWVQAMVDRLRRHHPDVWLDQEDIPASVPWMREIDDAIAEAYLVVCCDSPAFRASANCAVEVKLAEDASKPRLRVVVGTDVDQAVAAVLRSAAEIEPRRRERTELRVAARDWDRGGRRSSGLVVNRRRRRLQKGVHLPPALSETERSFLRASRRRSLRRTTATFTVAVLTTSLFGLTRAFPEAGVKVAKTNLHQAQLYAEERAALDVVDQDPYAGLSLASGMGADEAQVHAAVVSRALRSHVPDDAFTVPATISRFAVTPVDGDVILADTAGRHWQRAAAASTVRSATRYRSSNVAHTAPSGAATIVRTGSGVVQVRVDGRITRAVTFDGRPSHWAVSPDGRLLAAAIDSSVQVADLSTGDIRAELRGNPGQIVDLAWSRAGDRVWAASAKRVVGWRLGDAVTLLDDPRQQYNAVLPSATAGRVWVVTPHELQEIDVADGRIRDRRTVDDEITSAGAAPDGSAALLSGKKHAWILPLSGSGAARAVDVPDCRYGRATFADAGTAYLPCIDGKLATISIGRGTVTATRSLVTGLFGARAVPGPGLLFIGDSLGHLYLVGPRGARLLLTSVCAASLARIAVSSDGRAVLPVGDGSGMATCTRVGRRPAHSTADWTFDAMIESVGGSIYATAAVFNRTGEVFAIGYSDGTVSLHPTQFFSPMLTADTAVGAVRDMLALPDGNIVLVTSAGMVQRLPMCDDCLSDAALSKEATARLQRALALGLAARRTPAPAPSPSR